MISYFPARVLAFAALLLATLAPAAPAQIHRTEYEGSTALGLAMRKLGVTKRVLMIGAHPDDESTQLLATLALGSGADVAYLSLTRGEGGQNGIGPELQEALGLLRSEELLAARRLDGARQYFTRAYDFGFSKSAEEAFRHWPRDSLLADVVAAVRHFRPHVILSVFSGTPRDGHGHHQAAGLMARAAFQAAADPGAYPDQLERGLAPHTTARLYQALWRSDAGEGPRIATGELDPLLGRSHYQIAMASRSRHRSQDMGQLLDPGPHHNQLDPIASAPGVPIGDGVFAGLDTTLAAIAGSALPAHARSSDPISPALLAAYHERVTRARERLNPFRPQEIVLDLAEGLRALRLLQQDAELVRPGSDLEFHLANEREDAERALWLASGLSMDVVASAETVVPGEDLELEVSLWNGGERPVLIRSLALRLPAGWRSEPLGAPDADLPPGALATRRFRVRVAPEASVTEPYFLRQPRTGAMYGWPPEHGPVGFAFDERPILGVAEVAVEGAPIRSEREATFRGLDKMVGEFRRPVRIVPAATILTEPSLAVLPLSTVANRGAVEISVLARSERTTPVSGSLRLLPPAGWTVEPRSRPIGFTSAGEEQRVEFSVRPPPSLTPGRAEIGAVLEVDGAAFSRGYSLVDYPHIDPRPLYRPAAVEIEALDVRVPSGVRVGYIQGAGDDVPAALEQLGFTVETIGPGALGTIDLTAFDVVVTGIRAYEVRPDLVAHNQRLLDYARRGGTVIVQYNKYEYTEPGIAPYPVEMSRPHDRITDEDAPVRILEPEHPVFTTPNRITPADFDGWVQERGLYHLSRWDDRFTPLLEMVDPGEAPQRGSLLIAEYGDGVYVYTGLAFFRQLPAGVPGAYRLFTNLLALGARR